MINNPKLSIGIPAYNEGNNIGTLLKSILGQKEKGFQLLEIIVVSDQSTDNTVSEVEKLNDTRVKLHQTKKRSGQVVAQNQILDVFKGDILVILNGDILIEDSEFLGKIIKPILKNNHVGLVSVRHIPLPPKTFFEKIINFSVEFKMYIFESWKNGINLFTCKGSARAFSKTFASKFRWPLIRGEDAYSYMKSLENKFEYKYVTETNVFFKSPESLQDHLNQSTRFFSNKNELYKFFTKSVVDIQTHLPKSLILSSCLIFFSRNPAYFVLYAVIACISRLTPVTKHSHIWDSPTSTKSLVNHI